MGEWEKILLESLTAVSALSRYAEREGFKKEMYEANKAWHILYDLPRLKPQNRERV